MVTVKEMNKLKLNNKGLTLVEVIVTIAIIGVILPVVYSIFSLGNISFISTRDRGLSQQEARILAEHLNNELRYATDISNSKIDGYNLLIIDDSEGNPSTLKKNDKTLVSGNWKIENLLVENGIIKGVIETNDDSNYKLAINIPLENIDSDHIEGMDLREVIYYKKP